MNLVVDFKTKFFLPLHFFTFVFFMPWFFLISNKTQTLLHRQSLFDIWFFIYMHFFGKDQACIWPMHELNNHFGFQLFVSKTVMKMVTFVWQPMSDWHCKWHIFACFFYFMVLLVLTHSSSKGLCSHLGLNWTPSNIVCCSK